MASTENSMAWLEAALAENLRPVSAPAGLWDRVEMPAVAKNSAAGRSMAWRLALTTAVAAALVVGLWSFGRAGFLFRSQEFRSSDPAAIRAWVKDRCGFGLPLSAGVPPEIRLSEVRLQNDARKSTERSAELAFNVENRPALLRISPVEAAAAGVPARHRAAGDAKSVSWVAEGRLFTLACATPEDLRIACSLCHAGGAL